MSDIPLTSRGLSGSTYGSGNKRDSGAKYLPITSDFCDEDVEVDLDAKPVTTRLRVQNICCELESTLIKKLLAPENFSGVIDVKVNTVGRVAIIKHQGYIDPSALVDTLNSAKLGATIQSRATDDNQEEDLTADRLVMAHLALVVGIFLVGVLGALISDGAAAWGWVALASVGIGIWPLLQKALMGLRYGLVGIDLLMVLAAIGAMITQHWIEAGAVVALFSLANHLQHLAMEKLRRAVQVFGAGAAKEAIRIESPRVLAQEDLEAAIAANDKPGIEAANAALSCGDLKPAVKTVLVENIKKGWVLSCRPGDMIPVDGLVVKGEAAVDESSITGESVPINKPVGGKVLGGTVVQNGYVEIEATSGPDESTLADLTQLVEEAQSQPSKFQRAVDRFAAYYTPGVIIFTAMLVTIVPGILGWNDHWEDWFHRGLVLLLTACPCAIVMSSPVPVIGAIAIGAKAQVLIKNGDAVEKLASVQRLVFDKTGTITEGKFEVADSIMLKPEKKKAKPMSNQTLFEYAAAVEAKSSHPLATAVVNHVTGCATAFEEEEVEGSQLPEVTKFKVVEGVGVQGTVNRQQVLIASAQHVLGTARGSGRDQIQKYMDTHEGHTNIVVLVDGEACMIISLFDTIRGEAFTTMSELHRLGQKVTMCTGDSDDVAKAVCLKVGIDEFRARQKPDEKLTYITESQASGEKVGMLGDGINDGPALAMADLGFAMGAGGTALAVQAADIVIAEDNLLCVPFVIDVGRTAKKLIFQNMFMAVTIKAGLTIAALFGVVTLWMAVVGDLAGLLLVVFNGMRMLNVEMKEAAPDINRPKDRLKGDESDGSEVEAPAAATHTSTVQPHYEVPIPTLLHKCTECPRSFNRPGGLQVHLRSHAAGKSSRMLPSKAQPAQPKKKSGG